MKQQHPTLYITAGLPSSGKTYFSKRLAADLGVFYLNVDDFRLAIIEKPTFAHGEHRMVYAGVNHVAEQFLTQGFSVVCNGNYNTIERRQAMYEMAAKYPAVQVCVLWVDAPIELLRTRIVERDHEIPVEKMVDPPLVVLARMQKTFVAPQAPEPFVKIDGTAPYSTQRQQFDAQFAAAR